MPISKRDKRMAKLQIHKKSKNHKSSFVQNIRDVIDSHSALFLFSYDRMRSNHFKELRLYFRSSKSRIILGKNTLIRRALGTSPSNEYSDNLHVVSRNISGTVGLLFTVEPPDKIVTYFQEFHKLDYAREGFISPQTVIVTNMMMEPFPVSMVEVFRKLGLIVDIYEGNIKFVGDLTEHTLCRKGDVLTVEKCKILFQLGIKLSEFRVKLICQWNSSDGSLEKF